MKIQYHKHHIIPKHAGGKDDPSNILRVNTAMHAYLHKCLFEEYGRWQDEIAWKGLSKQLGKQDLHREMITKSLSNPETKLKMRNKKLGRNITQKHADALHAGRRNSKNSEEHNRKLVEFNTGRKIPEDKIRKGWKHKEESNEKNRQWHLNQPPKSIETREKLRQKALLYWENKRKNNGGF